MTFDSPSSGLVSSTPKLEAHSVASAEPLARWTTLRVGGPARSILRASTAEEFIDAVRAADRSGDQLLVLGGGSNLLVSDEGFDGVVVRDMRQGFRIDGDPAGGTVTVCLPAGQHWDEFVAEAVRSGWAGVEALAGIPGTVGAAPVQNIGAYGQQIADVIAFVRCWDRQEERVRTLRRGELHFGYRNSLLKRSLWSQHPDRSRWYPTPRFVVLNVGLRLRTDAMSGSVEYAQLADRLSIAVGGCAPVHAVRQAVLSIRDEKAMLLRSATPNHEQDHDRWSAGSFFTNPIISSRLAATLPTDAPRFPVVPTTSACEPVRDGAVKTSAAWLIEHAGFGRGYGVHGDSSPARLSTRHTLALTNRGQARARDLLELASTVQQGVEATFGVRLEPEPVIVGATL